MNIPLPRRTVRILMFGASKRVSVGRMFIEAGRSLGIDVELISSELSPLSAIASIAEVVVSPPFSSPGSYEWILDLCRSRNVDIMLPFIDSATVVASRLTHCMDAPWTPVASPETVATFFDKRLAARLFEDKGIPTPTTLQADNPVWPKIAKPATGSASQGIRVLRGPADIALLDHRVDDYLIQEYIPNRQEYTIDAYIGRDGRIYALSCRERLEVSAGEVTVTTTVDEPAVAALARRVIGECGLKGAITVQILRDLDHPGRLLALEVNPRPGGGVVCSIHAGADIPRLILADYLGLPLTFLDARPGTTIARYPQEVLLPSSLSPVSPVR